eukprot:m.309858 g.309858  ORF g.309858 m.309858 type:complete len:90 (+) comp20204_c0_seq5:134-403(+)
MDARRLRSFPRDQRNYSVSSYSFFLKITPSAQAVTIAFSGKFRNDIDDQINTVGTEITTVVNRLSILRNSTLLLSPNRIHDALAYKRLW